MKNKNSELTAAIAAAKEDITDMVDAMVPTTPKSAPKTATITLHAADGSVTMQIVAERTASGARTYVITTDADKKTSRGMTAVHPSWDAAVASTAATAKAAEKLGLARRTVGRMFTPKPDAFSSLAAALKAASKGKK